MDEDFKAELDWANERYDDLVAFTGSEAFGELSAEDQDLIVQQCSLLGHYKQIVQMRDEGLNQVEIAKKLGCHKSTVSRALKNLPVAVVEDENNKD